jgi:hypothetical protein
VERDDRKLAVQYPARRDSIDANMIFAAGTVTVTVLVNWN